MAQEYSPTEIFKRATAATLRAIAERDDVTVGFGPEAAGVSGARVRTAKPAARPAGRGGGTAARCGRQRGACGCAITTMRCTANACPGSPLARAVFEAVEQARVEATGLPAHGRGRR